MHITSSLLHVIILPISDATSSFTVHVLRCKVLSIRHFVVEYFECDEYGPHVCLCRIVQPRSFVMGYRKCDNDEERVWLSCILRLLRYCLKVSRSCAQRPGFQANSGGCTVIKLQLSNYPLYSSSCIVFLSAPVRFVHSSIIFSSIIAV